MTVYSAFAMNNHSSEHWLALRQFAGAPIVFGISQWDMPDGHRLRREMRRSTSLSSESAIRRWAKRYQDVSQADVEKAVAHLKGTAV